MEQNSGISKNDLEKAFSTLPNGSIMQIKVWKRQPGGKYDKMPGAIDVFQDTNIEEILETKFGEGFYKVERFTQDGGRIYLPSGKPCPSQVVRIGNPQEDEGVVAEKISGADDFDTQIEQTHKQNRLLMLQSQSVALQKTLQAAQNGNGDQKATEELRQQLGEISAEIESLSMRQGLEREALSQKREDSLMTVTSKMFDSQSSSQNTFMQMMLMQQQQEQRRHEALLEAQRQEALKREEREERQRQHEAKLEIEKQKLALEIQRLADERAQRDSQFQQQQLALQQKEQQENSRRYMEMQQKQQELMYSVLNKKEEKPDTLGTVTALFGMIAPHVSGIVETLKPKPPENPLGIIEKVLSMPQVSSLLTKALDRKDNPGVDQMLTMLPTMFSSVFTTTQQLQSKAFEISMQTALGQGKSDITEQMKAWTGLFNDITPQIVSAIQAFRTPLNVPGQQQEAASSSTSQQTTATQQRPSNVAVPGKTLLPAAKTAAQQQQALPKPQQGTGIIVGEPINVPGVFPETPAPKFNAEDFIRQSEQYSVEEIIASGKKNWPDMMNRLKSEPMVKSWILSKAGPKLAAAVQKICSEP